MTPLIISADDYAQSAAIDAGILRLIEQGRVTAASCLTLSPRWPLAAQGLTSAIRAKADLGVHLDFTQYGNGICHPLPGLIMRTLCRALSLEKIRASITQQLDRFETFMGQAPDYIDGHQHVHQLPQIREVLLDTLAKRYSGRLPWIRVACPPARDGLKGWVIAGLGTAVLSRKAKQQGIPCSSPLLGVYDFDTDSTLYCRKLEGWLRHAASIRQPVGSLPPALMCHPALQSAQTDDDSDVILQARFAEYAVFADQKFPELLTKHKIVPSRGNTGRGRLTEDS